MTSLFADLSAFGVFAVRSVDLDQPRRRRLASARPALAPKCEFVSARALSSLVLELATSLVSQLEPLQRRCGAFQNLIRTYRQVEGEVHPTLIKEGFLLADQMREEEEAKGQSNQNKTSIRGLTQAEYLEIALLSEYARDNFDAAIRYVRSLPDNEFKLAGLLQMAQSLRQPF